MASISQSKTDGTFRLMFAGTDGKRKTLYLGAMPKKAADSVRAHVEEILSAALTGTALPRDTAAWVGSLGDELRSKLEKAGLVEAKVKKDATPTIAAHVRAYIARRTDARPSTLVNLHRAETMLVEFAGTEKRIDQFTKAEARNWLLWMKEKKYANATISRMFRRGAQFFKAAIEGEILTRNPLAGIKTPSQKNKERQHFIPQDVARKVIEAGTDASWRLVIALSRFGGLRIPSELVGITWQDVRWDDNKFRVRSPKTEHHEGKGERWVPIYPELRPYLVEAFEAAPDGAVRIFPDIEAGTNLGQRLSRTIEAAGVSEWPKLFQNMRSSRQTELSAVYPITDVCAWMGNSLQVAGNHYLQPLGDSFQRAAEKGALATQIPTHSDAPTTQIPTQTASDRKRLRTTDSPQPLADVGVRRILSSVVGYCHSVQAPRLGLEPRT